MDRIWMRVSSDEYELPEAVADTAVELAQICKTTPDVIYSEISMVKAGKRVSCPWVCVPC